MWVLFNRQWAVAGFGGVIGWRFEPAIELLIHGHMLKGDALLAEIERLATLERAQMEIESARQKAEEEKANRKSRTGSTVDDHVAGDLDDFEDVSS